MNKKDFIELIDNEIKTGGFYIKSRVIDENNIKYMLVPYIFKNVSNYFDDNINIFKLIVKLEEGLFYISPGDLITCGGYTDEDTNEYIDYYYLIGLGAGLIGKSIADVLVEITKEELIIELNNNVKEICSNIVNF